MEDSKPPVKAQQVGSPEPLRPLNILPLAVSTLLLTVSCLLSPLALLMGLYNDTGDVLVTTITSGVLIVGFLIVVAHVIVVSQTLRSYKSTNGLCAMALGVNKAFLVSTLLVPIAISLISLMPSNGTGTSDTSAYLLLILAVTLATTIVPALAITSIVLSVLIIKKRTSISATRPPVS